MALRPSRSTDDAALVRSKYWEIIANRLMKAGWTLGWVSAIDSNGRTMWITTGSFTATAWGAGVVWGAAVASESA
jgi:hypothetical protein